MNTFRPWHLPSCREASAVSGWVILPCQAPVGCRPHFSTYTLDTVHTGAEEELSLEFLISISCRFIQDNKRILSLTTQSSQNQHQIKPSSPQTPTNATITIRPPLYLS